MQLLGFTTAAMMLFIVGFAFDLGGSVCAVIFLFVLLIGGTLRAWQSLVDWVRGPSARL